VIYGMGFSTKENPFSLRDEGANRDKANEFFKNNSNRTTQLINTLPSNRELINKIHEFGLAKI
jgi:tryptophan halogenase